MTIFNITQSDIPGAKPSEGDDCILKKSDPMYNLAYQGKLRLKGLEDIEPGSYKIPVIDGITSKKPKPPPQKLTEG